MRIKEFVAHSPRKAVAFLPFTNSYVDLISNLMLSLERTGFDLSKELVLVPLDNASQKICERGFYKWKPGSYFCTTSTSLGEDPESPCCDGKWMRFTWVKVRLLYQLVDSNLTFLLIDSDLVFLQNPMDYFDSFTTNIAAARKDASTLNTGLLYVRSSPILLDLFKNMFCDIQAHPGRHDQAVFNSHRPKAERKGLTSTGISKEIHNFCEKRSNCSRPNPKVVSVHFSCVYPGAPKNKQAQMERYHCWFLDQL